MKFDADAFSRKLALPFVLVGVLLYLHLCYAELVVRHDRPIQIDELFFATCAARSSELGQWLSAGCHDNKGPVIYVLYSALHRLGGVYQYAAYKSCALLLGLVLAGLAGRLAARLTGIAVAGAACFALVLLVFALDPWLVALKPELVGAVFMLAAICLLDGREPQVGRAAAAGLLLGLAFLTKQTFLFVALSLFVVLLGMALLGKGGQRGLLWVQLLGFVLGGMTALFGMALVFFLRGDLIDAVSSLFVYPSVYASKLTEGSMLKRGLSKLVDIAAAMQPFVAVLVFAAAGAAWRLRATRRDGSSQLPVLLLAVGAGSMAALLVAPIFLRFHLLPLLVIAAIYAAAMLVQLMVGTTDKGAVLAVPAGLAVFCGMVALSAWGGAYANPLRDEMRWSRFKVAGDRGAYAYVIGTWPEFYVQSGFIPASRVLYPTGLPGAPATWAYEPPDQATWKGAKLLELQTRNAEQLKADFAATPPKYILVNPAMARSPGSERVTDIVVLDLYLQEHCRASGQQATEGREYRLGTLYVCDSSRLH
jgi:hypothetical protein